MFLWWQVWTPQNNHQARRICVNWAYVSIIWATFDELLMLLMDLNMNPCHVNPGHRYIPMFPVWVCYCRLNISIVLRYFSGDVSDMIWKWSVIYMNSTLLMCLYIYTSQYYCYDMIDVQGNSKASCPHISLFKSCYVLWLPAWWALWLSWWLRAGYNNALMYSLIFTMNSCYCFIVVFCWK